MNDLTMGQRIAERRKLLGLSQEALGERMGVSRQAISKWESDMATPEIDKLISLSKLFGVSIGWLLGTEEETASGDAKDGFTEEQMKTIEEIVRRYQIPAPQPRKHWPLILVCCGVLLGVILLAAWMAETRSLIDDYRWQLSSLESDYSSVQSRLSSVQDQLVQMADAAEEQNDLLSDFSWEILSMVDSDHGQVRLSLIPKNWQEGNTATVTARLNAETAATGECTWDGTAWNVRLELPPENGYVFYYTLIHADGTWEQQRLQCPDAENMRWYMEIYGDVYFESCQIGPEEVRLEQVTLIAFMPDSLVQLGSNQVTWTQCDFALYKNGQETDRVSLPDVLAWNEHSTEFHAPVEELTFQLEPLAEGEWLELWVEAALSNGQNGRIYAGGWMLEDGEIIGVEVVE